ncbi:MAG: hypothetical protein GEU98_25755 [Pseudonocardiaceae bacterium]|nr:hypothetical protein [Pseudonocardiaceae bacterium]
MPAELGSTKDPKALIPGEPDSVAEQANALRDRGTKLESAGNSLGKVDAGSWIGAAADAFLGKIAEEPPKWLKMSDALSTASQTLTGFSDTLRWAQEQAAEAIDLWEQGEQATKQAQAEAGAGAGATPGGVPGAVAGGFMPVLEDPGEKLREQARQILQRAREQLEEAGGTAAGGIGGKAGTGLPGVPGGGITGGVRDVIGDLIDKAQGLVGAEWGDRGSFERNGVTAEGGWSVKGPNASGWDVTGPSGSIDLETGEGTLKLGEVSGEANLFEAGVDGSMRAGDLSVSGSANASLGAAASASASLGADGFNAEAEARAGLHAEAEASAEYGIASANVSAEGDAGAMASGNVTVGPEGVNAGGEAFIGAKGEVSGGVEVGGVGVEHNIEGWVGAGVEADVNFGKNEDGSFTIGGEIGAGLGLGGSLGGSITIDPAEIGQTIGDAADAVGDAAGTAVDAVGDAAGAVGNAAKGAVDAITPW